MTIKRRIPIMKKTYEKPTVETVKFQYRDQVVVASGACQDIYTNRKVTLDECQEGNPEFAGRTNV